MPLVKTYGLDDFLREFATESFSADAKERIFEYYDEEVVNVEMDCESFVSEWNEYPSFREAAAAYDFAFAVADDRSDEENAESVIETLGEHTAAFLLPNGHILVGDF